MAYASATRSGLNHDLNRQLERALQARVQQASIVADTEEQKIQTVRWKLMAEKHRTTAESWKANTESIKAQRAQTGHQIEQVGLATDRVKLDTARVGLGKEQDRFAFEQADRYLTQLNYRETLTAKAIDVAALREQVRTKTVTDGAGVPFFLAQSPNGAYGLPAVAGLTQSQMRRG